MTPHKRIEIDRIVFERRGSQVAYWGLNGRRRAGPISFVSVRHARKNGQKFLDAVLSDKNLPEVRRDLLAHGGAWLAIASKDARA